MLPAFRFIRGPRQAFRDLKPPAGWARLEPLGWVALFLSIHASLFYSRLLTLPHLLPALAGALGFVLAHALVFSGAVRVLGGRSFGGTLWAAPLTLLPMVVFLLVAYVPVQVATPDLFYDYFFYENLRFTPGIAIIIAVLAGTTHLARVAAQEVFGLPRARAIAVGSVVGAFYVAFGLLLYGLLTSGDLLSVI